MIKFFAWLGCLCLSFTLLAQNEDRIRTENDLGAEDLIKNVFIKGNCRNVSNISAIGDEIVSIGQFENGGEIININDGIILTTGDIALAEGPNNDNEATLSLGTVSTDSDLSELATDSLFDATGIEFDFVPIGNRVTFRYVFASEEYCEFVGTAFNDVFGFFVSGPGINGEFDNNAINVAIVPETDDVVSINTINHLDNNNFYVNNATNIDAESCDIDFVALFADFIEYDGFTVPLTASFEVIPCETYHIRLIISDVGDDRLDSAVFLETNSFDLGEPVSVRAEVPGSSEPIAYENCIDGQFVFTRNPLSDIRETVTVAYNISSDNEAISGVDFVEIPMSVTIPAGETSVTLPVTVIEDDITEGIEDIKLELVYDCDCIDAMATELFIDEVDDLSVNFENITVCANQTFSITPEISGGVAPFNFLWETGLDTSIFQGSVTEPTQYAVTITDFCSNTSSGLANIGIQSVPRANVTGIYDICETVETGIPVLLEGSPPWEIAYSIDGIEQVPIENIQSNPFYLSTPTEGNYELIAFNDAFCEGTIIGSAEVGSPFFVETDIIPPSCFNSADGSISITQLDAVAPFSVEWNIETEDDFLLENLTEDTYTLNIVDGDGCFYEEIFDLSAISANFIDCSFIYIPNTFSPNNDGVNDNFSIFFNENNAIKNIISLQIYSRLGELIFEQANFLPTNGITGWEGEYQGRPLDAGVYIYKINLAFEDSSTLLMSGDITLIR